MGEMQLNYLLVGNDAYPSGVLVDPSSNVEALATAIKKASELSAVELCQIQLFLAKQVSGDWIRVDAAEVDALMAGDENSIASMVCRLLLQVTH
ncbi:hypothetical protein PF005_g19479 [Phytophthora fragariae]|uniref:Uncharacterized protein n=1 Tax=Phytophthora fragariae TaxID=53985 RepID=A0A6A3WYR2_9STRA|nr:hypothetical protein PF003_g30627 [Phytophthora fragariae]KAE8929521.1 hypothetical protein PF009_g20363 [Phytophthora fragariae]KAE8990869.1 hypothetical protein PF011_g18179 [Phytophthora fragariae]KAE9088982.1 hypothetical protein PF007_g19773 [Phytophthora fragariae]KAE9089500.1 hypothetical protein PF010_g18972 [Phytophthora fragariae]